MSVLEDVVKEQVTETPRQYRQRVRLLTAIYIVLYIVALVVVGLIVWQTKLFITLTQRSNVETLTIAIIFVLALYYLVSTFKGFWGAVRIVWYNLPALGSGRLSERLERRKQEALPLSKGSKSAYFDKAITLQGKPGEALRWDVSDNVGKLGELQVEGVKATYYGLRGHMNNSIFEFLASQLEDAMQKQDADAELQITQWSSIDADAASAYYSMVQAFQNLQGQLKGEPLWPTVEITQEDVDNIGVQLRLLVPMLRDECFMPDLEYSVEYQVPIIPEPLGFVQLSRNDNRADPVLTMGCATLAMLLIMAILIFAIFFPPWVPSR